MPTEVSSVHALWNKEHVDAILAPYLTHLGFAKVKLFNSSSNVEEKRMKYNSILNIGYFISSLGAYYLSAIGHPLKQAGITEYTYTTLIKFFMMSKIKDIDDSFKATVYGIIETGVWTTTLNPTDSLLDCFNDPKVKGLIYFKAFDLIHQMCYEAHKAKVRPATTLQNLLWCRNICYMMVLHVLVPTSDDMQRYIDPIHQILVQDEHLQYMLTTHDTIDPNYKYHWDQQVEKNMTGLVHHYKLNVYKGYTYVFSEYFIYEISILYQYLLKMYKRYDNFDKMTKAIFKEVFDSFDSAYKYKYYILWYIGGSANKGGKNMNSSTPTYINYQKRRYRVRHDEKKKYISVLSKVVYLSDIRGKYKYVA